MNQTDTLFRAYSSDDTTSIEALLKKSYLPYEDIITSKVDFIVAIKDEQVIGTIGVEKFERIWLLRSFAVADTFKGVGIGNRLLEKLIEKAQIKNCRELHLLTTTAENYFSKKGFIRSSREFAPKVLQSTKEFSEICPVSSAYMVLNLSKQK